MNGSFRVPEPVNEPVRAYGPGLIGEEVDQGEARRVEGPGDRDPARSSAARRCAPASSAACVMPCTARPRPRDLPPGRRAEVERAIAAALRGPRTWSSAAVGRARLDPAQGRRPPGGPFRDDVNAATMLGQSQDRVPGRDRLGVRADRLLALQRLLRARRSTPSSRVSRRATGTAWSTGPRRLRLRGDAVQLHLDRRQPPDLPPALMGNTVVWKPASTAVYCRATTS